MNNRIKLILSGELSKDTASNINKQVREIEKNLKKIELDTSSLEGLKKLEKIQVDVSGVEKLQKELSKLEEKSDELKKTLGENGEGISPKITPELDEKPILLKLKDLEERVQRSGGTLKYNYDTTGAEKSLVSLTATLDEFGRKRKEVFKPMDEKGELWGSTSLTKQESTVRELANSYEKVKNSLERANRESKITSEQFKQLTSELDKFKNSKSGIEEVNTSLKTLQSSNQYITQVQRSLEKLVVTEKISKGQMQEQMQIMRNMGDLNKTKYDALKHSIDMVVQSNRKRTQELKQEERAITERAKAEERLLDLQNRFIRVSKYKPKATHMDGYGDIAKQLKDISFNQATMSTKELNSAIAQVNSSVKRLSASATEAGRTQIGLVGALKLAMEKFPVWMGTTALFYGSIRSAKEFMNIIVEIDSKMVDLRKVMSDGTDFEAVFERAHESAEKFGQTLRDTLDSYSVFARQGFEGEELGALADAAVVAGNVADMTSGDAADYLTSSIIQWSKDSDEAMDVIDKWNEISNNFATTTENLAQGQARAGSVAKTMGMDFEELNGIVAVTTAMTKQSGNEIGNFVKSVLPRLTSAPAKKALEMVNVELVDTQGNLRNIIDIYKEVAVNIKELNSSEQTEVLEGLAGKYHISRISALIDDLGKANSMYDEVMESQANATGSAVEENEEYLKSFEARINEVRRKVEEMSLALGEAFLTDTMSLFLETAGKGIDTLVKFIDTVGALPPILVTTSSLLLLFSKNARGFAETLIFGTSKVSQSTLELLKLEQGMTRTSVASAGLKTGLRGLLVGTGVGIAMAGIGVALEHLVGKMAEAKQRTEEFRKALTEQADSYKENQKDIDGMISKVSLLEKQLESGSLTEEERLNKARELTELQKELAGTFPELIAGEDEYGNQIYKSSDILENRIDLLKRQIELEEIREERERSADREGALKDSSKDYDKAEKRQQKHLKKLLNQIDVFKKEVSRTEAGTEILSGIEEEVKSFSDVQKVITELNEKQQSYMEKGNEGRAKYIQEQKQALLEIVSEYEFAELEKTSLQAEYSQLRTEQAISEIKKMNDLTANEQKTLSLIEVSISGTDVALDEIDSIYEHISKYATFHTEEFRGRLGEYQDSLVEIKELTNKMTEVDNKESDEFQALFEERNEKIKETKSLLLGFMSEIKESMESAGVDTTAIDEVVDNLEKAIEGQLGLATGIKEVGESSGVSVESVKHLAEAEEELGDIAEETEEKLSGLERVMKEIFNLSSEEDLENAVELLDEYREISEIASLLSQDSKAYAVAMEEQESALLKLLATSPKLLSLYEQELITKEEALATIEEEINSDNMLSEVLKYNVDERLEDQEREVLASYLNAQAKIEADSEYIRELNENTAKLKKELAEREEQFQEASARGGHLYTTEMIGHSMRIAEIEQEIAEIEKSKGKYLAENINKKNEYQKELEALYSKYKKEDEVSNKKSSSTKTAKEKNAERNLREQEKRAREEKSRAEKQQREEQRRANERQKQVEKARAEAEREKQEQIRKANEKTREAIRLAQEYAQANETVSYAIDKHKRALEELNLALKQQQAIKELFPEYSDEYQGAIESELELEQKKLDVMKQQANQQKRDLQNRKVTQKGIISSPQTMRSTSTRGLSGWNASPTPKLIGEEVNNQLKPTYASLQSNVEGIVKRAFKDAKQGNVVVVVDSAGNEHRYKDLSSVKVRAGQRVGVGSQLGRYQQQAGLTYADYNYAVKNAGRMLNPQQWIKQAQSLQNAGQGNSTVGNMVNVSREEAEKAQELYQLETDILSMQGDILDQHLKIEKMQLELIRAELSRFDKRRSNYDKSIDTELAKYDMLDKASRRHTAVIERQTMFMGYKQEVNKEELEHLKSLIEQGNLQGRALEEVRERYDNLRLTITKTTTELANMKKQWIDSQLVQFTRDVEYVDFELAKLNQTLEASAEGSTQWKIAMESQSNYLFSKRSAIKQEIEQLSHLIRQSKELTPDAVEEYRKRLRELTLQYGQLSNSIEDTNKRIEEARENASRSIADRIISAYKDAIRQKQEIHIASLDKEMEREDKRHKNVMDNYRKEMDEFRKLVDDKIKQMDREERSLEYDEEMEEYGSDRGELVKKINLLSLDDSREAKYERRRLEEELANLDKEIAKRKRKHEIEQRKESLNDLVEDKQQEISEKEELENEYHERERERIDKLREYWNQHYNDLLNDEKKFATMREDVAKGSLGAIEREFKKLGKELKDSLPSLANTMDGTMRAVGTSIRENVISELEESLKLLNEFHATMNAGGIGGTSAKDPFVGIGGASYDSDKGTWNTSYSRADGKVIVGKFMRDHVWRQEDNKIRQGYIRERGAQVANEGRAEGSKIDNKIRYDELVRDMSPEDAQLISEMMNEYARTFSTPELRDYLEKQAKRLRVGASFDTGGYTGNWGDSSGRLALLHSQELVLNTKETNKFGNILSKLEGIDTIMSNIFQKERDNSSETNINLYMDIDKLEGDSKSVKKFGKRLIEELNREYGRR